MRYAQARFQEVNRVPIKDGVVLVGPGAVTGALSIVAFFDPERHIGRDSGFCQFTFSFADDRVRRFGYKALLAPWAFWPNPDLGFRVRPAIGPFKEHVTMKVVMDTQDDGRICFEDGATVVSAHKYNDVTIMLREEDYGPAARLTVYVGDKADTPETSYLSVDYEIPLEHLLWRKAPVFYDDDVMPESADYVDVRRLTTPPMPGETPSAIRIEDDAG